MATAERMRPGAAGSGWNELVAGASVVHQQAITSLDAPALIIELSTGVFRAVNQAAADVYGLTVPEMLGRVNTELVHFDDEERVHDAMAALTSGAIDCYRARRRMTAADGVVKDVYVWCRAIEVDGARWGVYILSSSPADAGLPVLPFEPLAVGTVGPGWVLERVSAEIRDIVGWEPRDCIDRPLLADVHPDDVGDLVRATENVAVEDMVARRIRLRHRDRHWVPVQCLLVRLTDDMPPRVAFAIMPDRVETSPASADRISELEKRLRRIAAELRAAGVMEGVDRLPHAGDHPELNQLSTRQWQILVRLLRGDRVPTIARELHLSPSTVRNHLTAIFGRFEVHSQAELLAVLRPR